MGESAGCSERRRVSSFRSSEMRDKIWIKKRILEGTPAMSRVNFTMVRRLVNALETGKPVRKNSNSIV